MRESTLWLFQLITGAILFFLLLGHITLIHFYYSKILYLFGLGAIEAIRFEEVVARGRSALIASMYVIFLAAALYHGLYGFRNIVFELTANRPFQRAFSLFLIIAGAVTFIYGAYAAIAGLSL